MDFGFTLKPDHTMARTIALSKQAEAGGFTYGWLFDSHVLWKDPYPVLTVMALNTQKMLLGTCVTNPGTREPSVTASALATLDEISGGRMVLGIGRGDSARRVMGKPPTTLARLEEATTLIRDLVEGKTVDQEGTDLHFTWTRGDRLPVWVAGYGPKALELTARVADGVILQLADPDLIRWFVDQLRESARQQGRDPNEIKVMYTAFNQLGLTSGIGQYVSVILVLAISATSIFLMRQYFLTIPRDLEEAARIDGAGFFTTFSRVMPPITISSEFEVGSRRAGCAR